VRAECAVPIISMIRPRPGDFVMRPSELTVMAHDIACARDEGMNGIAVGVLLPGGRIDLASMAHCVERAGPMSVTMHRAFDQLIEPLAALDALAALGVERVLTSGGARTAMDGAGALASYVAHAGARITILPGGSIRAASVAALLATVPTQEVHARGTEPSAILALVEALASVSPPG
jgi:copper homeostasis protein